MDMRERFISVIIPNHNSKDTIDECLRAAFASAYGNYEVVVVDDASVDGSTEIIKRHPCRLIELKERRGVSRARNLGAKHSRGEVFLFIDADCLLQKNSLAIVNKSFDAGAEVLGGSYTPIPRDHKRFFSTFQSVFVNYYETRKEPDYLAAHCLALHKKVFFEVGGFIEDSYLGFEAGVEDVELSHRLRRRGYELKMQPGLLVRHIFNFSLFTSLKNAYQKSRLWVMYSIKNRDILASSGTASLELKLNVVVYFLVLITGMLTIFIDPIFLALLSALFALNVYSSRGLLRECHRVGGKIFTLKAASYYFLLYPMAVGLGAFAGGSKYLVEGWRR
jgi:glycosyltransferase involved in cell wall biosynthesis